MTTTFNKTSTDFPTQFQKEAVTLISKLVPVSGAVFYLLSPDMRNSSVVLLNTQQKAFSDYQRYYSTLDPLDPRKFNNSDKNVVTIDSLMPIHVLRETIYYQDFMQPYDHRYVADIFLRREGQIVAVLSVLRQEALGPYNPQELKQLNAVQPFLQFTLNSIYIPKRVSERQSLQEKYALTQRELDVVELVIAGASNKHIAKELVLGLATVKTHLMHIFKKTNSNSKAELLALVIADLRQSE